MKTQARLLHRFFSALLLASATALFAAPDRTCTTPLPEETADSTMAGEVSAAGSQTQLLIRPAATKAPGERFTEEAETPLFGEGAALSLSEPSAAAACHALPPLRLHKFRTSVILTQTVI